MVFHDAFVDLHEMERAETHRLRASLAIATETLKRIAAPRPLTGPLCLTDLDMQDMAREALIKIKQTPLEKCEWSFVNDARGTTTSCGVRGLFLETDANVNFCPFCGREVYQ